MFDFINYGKSIFSGGSFVMANREKLGIADLIRKTDGVITIVDIDLQKDRDNELYLVFSTAEMPDYFTFGGKLLTEWAEGIINSDVFNGNAKLASKELREAGGYKVILETKKSLKTHNNYTAVTPIE